MPSFLSFGTDFGRLSTLCSGLTMVFTLTVVTRTDVGCVRKRNEDAVTASPEHGIVVVADGMGGHPSGDEASRIASREALDVLLTPDADALDVEIPDEAGDSDEDGRTTLGLRMAKAVVVADRRVREAGEEDPEKDGMGTTLTALLADADTGRWVIGHVGDSRGYRLRDGELEQITRDDSWVQEQIDAGLMTAEDARHHPWSSVISQALGLDKPARPSVHEGTLRAGDLFLLCSDGLCGLLDDREMREVVENRGPGELDEAADLLVEGARARGGHDNITVGLLHVGESG